MNLNSTVKWPIWLAVLKWMIYGALFYGMYSTTASYLFDQWNNDNFSYCYLIPFIILYLLWEKKDLIVNQKSIPKWNGILGLIVGLFFFWIGELGGEYYILYISAWLILIGLCVMNMGFQKVKLFFFPLLMILTMFPPPSFINSRITLTLKLISSKLGLMMMHAYGISAFRDGNVIDLGFTKLQVVDACSGLRYLFPMIVLSMLMAYFYHGRIWKKSMLILSSVPLTIFSNSLRIALTGILSEKFGSKAVEGFFHDFEGWLIFMFTLGILVLEIWLLNKLFPEPKEENALEKEAVSVLPEKEEIKQSLLKPPHFAVSVLFLGITLVLSQGIEFREKIPMARPFDEFPMKIVNWEGSRQTMEIKFIEKLDLSDYIMVDYQDGSGKAVNFYVAYYESQRKGESIHSPATCLRGGGWQFKQAGRSLLNLASGGKMPVNRAIIEKKPVQQISYYWFPSRGRILTNAYEMKWYNFWDALTQQRTDGALVRIISLVYPDESVEATENRMKQFVSDINPVLKQYLPQ